MKLEESRLPGQDASEHRLSVEVRTSLDPGAGVSVERVINPSRSKIEMEGTAV